MSLAVGGQEGGVHQEHVQDVVITLDHGELERSVTIDVRNVHIGPDLDKAGHYLYLPVEHGDVEGRPLVVVEAVHLGALVHQGQDGVRVAPYGSVVESRVTSSERGTEL